MRGKKNLFYVLMICFYFTFFYKNIFSEDISLRLKQSINLSNLTSLSKNRLKEIRPKDGFIIEVRGKKEGRVIIELDIKEGNNGIKVVELKPEKKIIRLDKNGMGTFRIGALIAIKNNLKPGTHYSEVRARVKYIE